MPARSKLWITKKEAFIHMSRGRVLGLVLLVVLLGFSAVSYAEKSNSDNHTITLKVDPYAYVDVDSDVTITVSFIESEWTITGAGSDSSSALKYATNVEDGKKITISADKPTGWPGGLELTVNGEDVFSPSNPLVVTCTAFATQTVMLGYLAWADMTVPPSVAGYSVTVRYTMVDK